MLISINTFAFDGSYSVGARLYPKSAGVAAQAGIGQELWGEKKPDEFNYGFWRPFIKGFSSITVNQVGLGLDVFPISFLGVTFSHLMSHRSKDFADVPCDSNSCQGNVFTESAKSHVVFGFGNWFVLWETELAWVEPADKSIPFIDENTMLINNYSGDRFVYNELIVGYKLSKQWSSGFDFYNTKLSESKNENWHSSIWASFKKREDLSLSAGLGYYGSTIQVRDFTVYGVAKWNFGDSLSLIQ